MFSGSDKSMEVRKGHPGIGKPHRRGAEDLQEHGGRLREKHHRSGLEQGSH